VFCLSISWAHAPSLRVGRFLQLQVDLMRMCSGLAALQFHCDNARFYNRLLLAVEQHDVAEFSSLSLCMLGYFVGQVWWLCRIELLRFLAMTCPAVPWGGGCCIGQVHAASGGGFSCVHRPRLDCLTLCMLSCIPQPGTAPRAGHLPDVSRECSFLGRPHR
jgi:hypothetical protein